MSSVLPAPFLFRFALPVPRVDGLPRRSFPWLKLPASCRLLEPSTLEKSSTFADLRVAWNRDGLGLAVEVTGKKLPVFYDVRDPYRSDGLRVWIDTRDTKGVHHATRYCQHFLVLPLGGGDDGRGALVVPTPVARAREDAKLPDPDDILVGSSVRKDGYLVECWLPAATLAGFDPASQPRLGFHAVVEDSELGAQHLTVGLPFPVHADPSLWSTLDLRD
ncbi:MAG: hypothetical protein KF774_10950 [Planctomyces sp.]|nr:hypothetical protein [Planctomyces sp.]